MEWTPNKKQNKVIAYLKANKGAFTLAEIGEKSVVKLKVEQPIPLLKRV